MANNLFDLSGEVAAVMGATGILGGAISGGLAAAGARVVVLGRDEERGRARVEAIQHEGGQAEFVAVNATNRKDVEAAHANVTEKLGAVDILVNAVGGNDPKVTVTTEHSFESVQIGDWQANFDLNLTGGTLFPCQVFGPEMVRRGRGSIINISSVSAHIPLSRVVAYSAAKAAVSSMTRFLAREWANSGVRVNSITPGFFPAEQNRSLLFNEDGSPTPRAQSILDHTSMGRMGEPKELVGAAVFLASQKASSFITGTDIRVDGGFLSQTI